MGARACTCAHARAHIRDELWLGGICVSVEAGGLLRMHFLDIYICIRVFSVFWIPDTGRVLRVMVLQHLAAPLCQQSPHAQSVHVIGGECARSCTGLRAVRPTGAAVVGVVGGDLVRFWWPRPAGDSLCLLGNHVLWSAVFWGTTVSPRGSCQLTS